MNIEKKDFLKKHKMDMFIIFITVTMLIGFSYAWLHLTLRGEKELSVVVDSLYLELDDTMAGGIMMSEAIPITDEEGLN